MTFKCITLLKVNNMHRFPNHWTISSSEHWRVALNWDGYLFQKARFSLNPFLSSRSHLSHDFVVFFSSSIFNEIFHMDLIMVIGRAAVVRTVGLWKQNRNWKTVKISSFHLIWTFYSGWCSKTPLPLLSQSSGCDQLPWTRKSNKWLTTSDRLEPLISIEQKYCTCQYSEDQRSNPNQNILNNEYIEILVTVE